VGRTDRPPRVLPSIAWQQTAGLSKWRLRRHIVSTTPRTAVRIPGCFAPGRSERCKASGVEFSRHEPSAPYQFPARFRLGGTCTTAHVKAWASASWSRVASRSRRSRALGGSPSPCTRCGVTAPRTARGATPPSTRGGPPDRLTDEWPARCWLVRKTGPCALRFAGWEFLASPMWGHDSRRCRYAESG
jgi:hypothetical protein